MLMENIQYLWSPHAKTLYFTNLLCKNVVKQCKTRIYCCKLGPKLCWGRELNSQCTHSSYSTQQIKKLVSLLRKSCIFIFAQLLGERLCKLFFIIQRKCLVNVREEAAVLSINSAKSNFSLSIHRIYNMFAHC